MNQFPLISLLRLRVESLCAMRLGSIADSSFVQQIRQKTYTSNVMDETRSRRISEHQKYHRAMKEWRLEVHGRVEAWRAEIRGKEQAEMDARRLLRSGGRGVQAETSQIHSRPEMTPEQKREQELREELKKAQLDFDLAKLKLIRAQRQQLLMAKREREVVTKRRLLLQSSRKWIGSSDELKERINAALDNPQPFGFITDLTKSPSI
jgi:hypothetical protein